MTTQLVKCFSRLGTEFGSLAPMLTRQSSSVTPVSSTRAGKWQQMEAWGCLAS